MMRTFLLLSAALGAVVLAQAQDPSEPLSADFPLVAPDPVSPELPPLPAALEPWKDWATWNDAHFHAPPIFSDANQRVAIWPSTLSIDATESGAKFELEVRVFAPAWLSLPGSAEHWPQNVGADANLVVLERGSSPATKLEPGQHRIEGEFLWDTMPQRLKIPPQIGMLRLRLNGESVQLPNWDADGYLWLKRTRADEEAEREFLEAKVYRVLEDGIPMWLRTEIQLSVSGKSREEDLGHALPQDGGDWTIASVNSALPCAVDDAGRLKVQVRAGKWTVAIDAFRSAPAQSVGFAEGASPIAEQEIVAWRAKPDFRLVELLDIPAIDVSQTTFPEKWRDLPVHRWDTAAPFRLEEKMRGMGFQKPSGLNVKREFWLDDNGALMTFRDQISGTSQQTWRLDVSPGQTLGAARMEGEGQLITANPASGANGIEVRERNINLEAVGRIENARRFPASGWQADVDSLDATLNLPPGWRVFAVFGAERVDGAWLTTWTLLDLFLLLVFAMAVGRAGGPGFRCSGAHRRGGSAVPVSL